MQSGEAGVDQSIPGQVRHGAEIAHVQAKPLNPRRLSNDQGRLGAICGPAPAPAIRVAQLSYRYPGTGVDALDGVDLTVQRGTVMGLIGPNGAGKSTLLSLLTGVIPPGTGAVDVEGRAPSRGDHVKSFSALVPQEYAFYPDLSGRENLAFFAGIHDLPSQRRRERVASCAAICRLEAVLDRRSATYSGGFKRRLNLAIGLLSEPRILYLDEPTVGVDADSRGTIVEAIQKLRARGTTIIYTSHYMEEVEALCDRVAVIDRGRIVACDTLPSLLNRFGRAVLRVTLDRAPEHLEEALACWQPRWTGQREMSFAHIDQEHIFRLLETLNAQRVVVRQMSYGIGRLDDVYHQILSTDSSK